ncbi:MAG TPA: transposase [Dehalococcoidia bacterium]|nr:transposase [Dehalococcoidia bacterium]
MKKRRYSEVQTFGILKEVESGMTVVNAAREHGVSPTTIHRWKSKYAGMSLSELKRLKALEAFRQEYNNYRPHSSLGCLTPAEFARRYIVSLVLLFVDSYRS